MCFLLLLFKVVLKHVVNILLEPAWKPRCLFWHHTQLLVMWVSGCSARVCSKPRVSLIVKHGSCRDGASSSCGYGDNIALCLVSPPQVHGSAPGDGFLQSQVQLRTATRGVHRRPDLNRDPGSAVPEATTRMSSVPQQPPNRHLLSTYREYVCCVFMPLLCLSL